MTEMIFLFIALLTSMSIRSFTGQPVYRARGRRDFQGFIFTKRFPVAPTRSHDHPQLGCITPTDGRVNDVS